MTTRVVASCSLLRKVPTGRTAVAGPPGLSLSGRLTVWAGKNINSRSTSLALLKVFITLVTAPLPRYIQTTRRVDDETQKTIATGDFFAEDKEFMPVSIVERWAQH